MKFLIPIFFSIITFKHNKVIFEVYFPEAEKVNIAGNFNNWNKYSHPMERTSEGTFRIEIPLDPGFYTYKFVINGTIWREDPENKWKVDDGFGGFNSAFLLTEDRKILTDPQKFPSLEYTEKGVKFRFFAPGAKKVSLAGTFNNWDKNANVMKKKSSGFFEITLPLPPGKYQYKFVVNDNIWKEDPNNPAKVDDGFGGFNSVFILTPQGKILMKTHEIDIVPKDRLIAEEIEYRGFPLILLILWHQHQPRYPKDEKGDYLSPWVRLHGTKDYYDMAKILEEYPEIHVTINLTPSLLEMIVDLNNGVMDKPMRLSLKPVKDMTEEEKKYLIDRFFDANWDNVIRVFPRYSELLDKKLRGEIFSDQDLIDLKAWFNLAWSDPDFRTKEVLLEIGDKVTLRELVKKGRNFTEDEVKRIIEVHRKILKSIIPVHRKLMEKGQIEVSTTPFYHPILPLIYDIKLARPGLPDKPMPNTEFSYPEDAEWHVKEAIEFYQKIFGKKPEGMWPAEGSVAHELVPIFAKYGIKWIATDEKVLMKSLKKNSLTLEEKYRVYKVKKNMDSVFVVFRDTRLSDAIGFVYQKMHPVEAANRFILELANIYKYWKDESNPPVVAVILDGENAWEHYQNDAKEFFHNFYTSLSKAKFIKTMTISEYIKKYKPVNTLDYLFPGSWIGANFGTWIGESDENKAWEYLAYVRKDVENLLPELDKNKKEKVMRLIYIAEGSDWFWWYGDDQEVPGNFFDVSFRETLKEIYKVLNKEYPKFLDIGLEN
jgi:alpha-amylase/alpha-mannosidase (GH57 family)